jgi:hypothetical protein
MAEAFNTEDFVASSQTHPISAECCASVKLTCRNEKPWPGNIPLPDDVIIDGDQRSSPDLLPVVSQVVVIMLGRVHNDTTHPAARLRCIGMLDVWLGVMIRASSIGTSSNQRGGSTQRGHQQLAHRDRSLF